MARRLGALASSFCSILGKVGVFSADPCLVSVFSLPTSLTELEDAFALLDLLPQSNAVPGVFGVLFAEPKDANAPVPKPKAPDGDAMPALFSGGLRAP